MSASFTAFSQIKFHYLILGGGTAGLAVAARLSEDPDVQVGVIEAGPSAFEEPAITVPGRYGEAIGSAYDWEFETTPQPGLGGRSLPWPRGRVLGGTSALNLMAWNRGHKEDYDAWARLGNEGWGWSDLLPYFRRSETFNPPSASHQEQYNSAYQECFNGDNGPVQTTHVQQYSPSHQYWHQTLNTVGVSSSQDSLAGSNVGAWNMLGSVDPRTQERSYSASAYYLPVASRNNLHVLTNATVLRVLLEKSNDEWVATGACVRQDNNEKDIFASRETILSAGSVQSPQLLELSGIGRGDILREAGIDTKIHNANVGENLQDHMMTATIFEVLPTLSSRDDIVGNSVLREAADRAYYASKTGPWTMLPCSVAYSPLSRMLLPSEQEELHSMAEEVAQETGRLHDKLLTQQFASDSTPRGQMEFIFDLGNWSTFFQSEPNKKYGTMLQMLQYPFSRGSIHIRRDKKQSSVDDKPMIDPRYYLGPGKLDKKIMNYGQRMVNRICSTEPLSKIILGRAFPPPAETTEREEQLWEDFTTNHTITDWHRMWLLSSIGANAYHEAAVGTCAMGGYGGAREGVVDERLRVYGTRGLRVIDASIMPLQIGAHIQATVYAIAEKGAAMIKEDWTLKDSSI